MKAPAFDYVKPKDLPEALRLLQQYGAGAQVLAGGQSLMAIMNLGLAMPEILVDITGIDGLRDIQETAHGIRVGALVTHATLESSALIAQKVPLLWQSVPHVAHMAIRNVGTIGGSMAPQKSCSTESRSDRPNDHTFERNRSWLTHFPKKNA